MTTINRGETVTGHAVLLPGPLHGHWPTLIVFAVKLVKQRPRTALTILVVGDFFKKINDALDHYFTVEEIGLRENIRVVQMGGQGLVLSELMPITFESFGPYFTSLMSSSDIVCKTGKTYPGIKPPDVAIIDLFFRGIIHIIRSTSNTKVPTFGWLSVNTASMIRFSDNKKSGYGDVAVEAPILAKQLNKSVEEVSYEMYFASKGEIIEIPGVPRMYDYEFDNERVPLSVALPVIQLKNEIHRFLREVDGVISTSDAVFEPECNEALRAWFAEMRKKVYVVGPLTPKEHEISSSSQVSKFLQRMRETFGEHSTCYVSFGTFFGPQGPGLAKILEVILDMGLPLIYSSAANANLPADLIERMSQSDRVFVSSWIPQRMVLAHPAIGCFLTHAGQNSVSEAISAGVPLIAYAITADQTINAAYISLKHKLGYELLEIRTGEALAPAYRGVHPTGTPEAIEREIRDVLTKAFGSGGEEKRNNIRILRDKRNALWDDGGESKEDFERFIREDFP